MLWHQLLTIYDIRKYIIRYINTIKFTYYKNKTTTYVSKPTFSI